MGNIDDQLSRLLKSLLLVVIFLSSFLIVCYFIAYLMDKITLTNFIYESAEEALVITTSLLALKFFKDLETYLKNHN